MGKLYRRERSPYWWARWQDGQGLTHRESTRTADRRVATLWLSAKESEAIREGAGYPTARRITLAAAVAQYLEAHAPPIWSEKWHYTVKHWWRSRLLPDLGGSNLACASVTRETIDRVRQGWLAQDLKPPTVNRLSACGSGFFRWASDPARRYALENPFSRHKRFAEVKATPPPASEADLTAFVAAIPNPEIRRAASVALDTGMRFSEVRRIRQGDVQGELLHVVSSYGRGLTKNKRERWLLLTPRARAALEEQRQEAGDDLFASMPVNTRKAIHAAQKAAGVARFTWRDLRHYALTRAAKAGVRPHDLRGMAGWVGDESGRYVHPEAEGMRPFIEACAPGVPEAGSDRAKTEHSGDTPEQITKRNGSG